MKIEKYKQKKKPLIFIDESGFSVDAPRRHGYSFIGKRSYGKYNWNEKGRKNVIGALLENHLISTQIYSENINSDIFHSWISNQLIHQIPKKSILILDNASFHKRLDIQESVKKAGHILLYQPSYSPDLNPIEKKWAYLKAMRRKYQINVESLLDGFT